jgi:glutamate-5-semialdehyde dehydrogenase
MGLHDDMMAMGQRGVVAARRMAALSSRAKSKILLAMADEIDAARAELLRANAVDMENGRRDGLSAAMLDRLQLTGGRIDAMVKGMREVAALKDPVGERMSRWIRPNGLEIVKRRVPIGVIGIIYESRPNVTADTATLCIKTSNAVILRGGKESLHSNAAVADAMIAGGRKAGLPENAIQLVRTTDREAVRELVRMEGLVDLIIPRGGEALIRAVTEQALVPVIKHYKGVCHVYVDETADVEMAMKIAENAKCQRPATCNAAEKLLIHEKIAPVFLPRMAERFRELKVELRGDEPSRAMVPGILPATEDDWYAEYLDLILTVKIVPTVQAAIDHINVYGSHHSDAIITESKESQKLFMDGVDSAAVYVNASTRFTDGGEFGMGAEIGISTDKLHARGPMGLEELTTYKFLVFGDGQLRG